MVEVAIFLRKGKYFDYDGHIINHISTSHVTDIGHLFDGAKKLSYQYQILILQMCLI
ncbi:hypothetical protein ACP8HZ_03890 [Francisella noatunensis]